VTELTRPVREVPSGQRERAARTAEEWGYGRRVTALEIRHGRWFTDGPGYLWFHVGVELDHWIVHGIVKPGTRTRSDLAQVVAIVAGILGARRVYTPFDADLLQKRPGLRRYVKRLGLTQEDELGPYLELTGG
jgi:hypothetical protein